MVELCNQSTVDKEYATNTIKLLFELIYCTPEMLVEGWSPPMAVPCPDCLATDTSNEAICLNDHVDITNFWVKYACWLWHRQHSNTSEAHQINASSLMESCRVQIRKHIMQNISTGSEFHDSVAEVGSL